MRKGKNLPLASKNGTYNVGKASRDALVFTSSSMALHFLSYLRKRVVNYLPLMGRASPRRDEDFLLLRAP
ncbi:MAG: hypothetical protein ACP5LZ_05035 [Fervidicoccaceae archaeon]